MDFFKSKKGDNIFLLDEYEETVEISNTKDGKSNEQKHIKIRFAKINEETYQKLRTDNSRIFVIVEHKNSKITK